MKPIQVGSTLVISITRLSTFLPFSMADKVPDLQKSEMMSGYNEDSVNFLRFIPPFSYRVFTAKGLFNFYLINVSRFNYIISPDFLWIFLIILAVNFYLSMTKVSYCIPCPFCSYRLVNLALTFRPVASCSFSDTV